MAKEKAKQTTPLLPKLTPTQWALLGRMVGGTVLHFEGWQRSGWESRGEDRYTYGGSAKRVRVETAEALLSKGLLDSEEEGAAEQARLGRYAGVLKISSEGRRAWEKRVGSRNEARTNDPCHGCGHTASHTKGNLCRECQRALDRGLQALDEDLTERADEVPVYIGEAKVPYIVPFGSFGEPGPRKKLIEALGDLQRLVTRTNPNPPVATGRGGEIPIFAYSEFPIEVREFETFPHALADPESVHVVARLYEAILGAIVGARDSGYRDGESLILGLAKGRVTVDEYQDRLVKREGG